MKVQFKYPLEVQREIFGRKANGERKNYKKIVDGVAVFGDDPPDPVDLYAAWERAERADKFMRLLMADPLLFNVFHIVTDEQDATDMEEWGACRHIETDFSYDERFVGLDNPMKPEPPPPPKWWQRLLLRLAGHEAAA